MSDRRTVFSNSNGVTFGTTGGTVTASHNGLTTQTNQNLSLFATGNTTHNSSTVLNASTLLFNGLGGATVGFSNGSVEISAGAGGLGDGGNTIAASTRTAIATGLVLFETGNGITFGLNAIGGTVMTASHNGLTSQSTDFNAITLGGNTSGTTTFHATNNRTIFLHGGNNITLSGNGSSITISAGAGGGGIGGIAVNALTTYTSGTVVFSNSNGVTFGTNAQTITASVNSTSNVGLATAQTNVTWTVNSAGISLNAGGYAGTGTSATNASVTLNSNGLAISVAAPGGGAAATLSGYDGFANNELMAIAGGQATLWIDRFDLPCALQFDRFGLRITHSNATNSSGSATISVWVGMSTRNASTLSSVGSTSFTTAITQSGTVGSYSNYGGIKILPVPWTTTFTAGNYWLGIVSRTTTGGANMTFGNLANSQIASSMSGYFGSGSNATRGIRLAVGVYSVTTAGMPTAISITQIQGNSSAFLRQPAYLFMSDIF